MDTKTIYTEKWSLQIVLWWESHSQTILLEISPVNFINYDVPSHFFPFFYPFDNIVVFAVQTSWSIINAMWIYNSFRFCFRVLKKRLVLVFLHTVAFWFCSCYQLWTSVWKNIWTQFCPFIWQQINVEQKSEIEKIILGLNFTGNSAILGISCRRVIEKNNIVGLFYILKIHWKLVQTETYFPSSIPSSNPFSVLLLAGSDTWS